MKRLVYPLAVVVCAALTACGTSETQAPVEDRSVGYMPQSAPVVGPGYYAVQKGDTLYRISRAKGQTVADLVAWNNLSDPNAINEGQVLRVVPPEAGGAAPAPASAQTAAVADSSRDVQPLAGSDAPPKTTPSGEKQGYSESAATDGTATTGVAATGATREVEGVTWGWPTSGKIQRGFSLPQSKGIDVDGTKGQKVLAAADGRVIYSGTMSGYGNLVIIKHNDDLLSAYANNSSNLVTQGAVVTRGQPVAEMGGSATASLHFEIRRQGKPDDPLKYLPKR